MENETLGKQKRIVRKFGGRHLIFRQKLGGWWLIPKPYILVSSFRGPIWIFYGAGQIWLTHKKELEIDGWFVRRPRVATKTVSRILEEVKPQLTDFIQHCNNLCVEGTVVIEKKVLEFHWTFGNEPLEAEKKKTEHASCLEGEFQELVDAFLAAKEKLGI